MPTEHKTEQVIFFFFKSTLPAISILVCRNVHLPFHVRTDSWRLPVLVLQYANIYNNI